MDFEIKQIEFYIRKYYFNGYLVFLFFIRFYF